MWKLGSLHWHSSLVDGESTAFYNELLNFHQTNHSLNTLPPECSQSDSLLVKSNSIHSRDVYSFVVLLQRLLQMSSMNGQSANENRTPLKLSEMIIEDSPDVSQSLLGDLDFQCTGLLASVVEHRCPIQTILEDSIFNFDFHKIRQFFLNFSTNGEDVKASFFQNLIQRLENMPDETLLVHIFSLMISSRVIMSDDVIYNEVMPYFLIPKDAKQNGPTKSGDAIKIDFRKSKAFNSDNRGESSTGELFYDEVDCPGDKPTSSSFNYKLTNGDEICLKSSPLISSGLYKCQMVPLLEQLFCVHDHNIRVLLLQYLPHYVNLLVPLTRLRKLIMPQILLAIKDSSDELVALTFQALAILVKQFGVAAVMGSKRNKRNKYFTTTDTSRHAENSKQAPSPRESTSTQYSEPYTENPKSIAWNVATLASRPSPHVGKPCEIRTSPDGGNDELIHQVVANISDSVNGTQSDGENDASDDQWLEWGDEDMSNDCPAISKPIPPLTKSITDKLSSNRVSTNKVFDIKDIDFKTVNGHEEISDIFQQLEPKFNFNVPKTVSSKTINKKSSSTITSNSAKNEKTICDDTIQVDPSIFLPKMDSSLIQSEELGGTDDAWNDMSLELTDEFSVDPDESLSKHRDGDSANGLVDHLSAQDLSTDSVRSSTPCPEPACDATKADDLFPSSASQYSSASSLIN